LLYWREERRRIKRVTSTWATRGLIGCFGLVLCVSAVGQTNSWIEPSSYFWDEPASWSLGVLPDVTQNAVVITNANSKTVFLDSVTATNTSALTVSNLAISAANGETNTLQIRMGDPSATLNILSGLSVGSGGAVGVSISALTVGGISNGCLSVDGHVSVLAGGTVTDTNASSFTVVGNVGTGIASVSGGVFHGSTVYLGSKTGSYGVVSLGAGSLVCRDRLLVGGNGAGAVWQSGGQLIATNVLTAVGFLGPGQVTISNGTALAGDLAIGCCYTQRGATAASALTIAGGQFGANGDYTMVGCSGVGEMSVAGGVVDLNSLLSIGIDKGTGAVWVVDGQLTVTNGDTFVGCSGTGQMIVSNGILQATAVYVGSDPFMISLGSTISGAATGNVSGGVSEGTLTVAGGTMIAGSNLLVGADIGTTGMVWATGGQIIATNDATAAGYMSTGRMTVSNGVVETLGMFVGQLGDAQGTLTVAGGTLVSWADVVVGDCATNAAGQIILNGGNLIVTNAGHNAVLDVRHGTLTVNSGLLLVDTLVMTNPCAQFVRTGGTVTCGAAVLDPNSSLVGDGIPNGWKQQYGLDPFDSNLGNEDPDGDGFTNLQEYQTGTDPTNSASAFRIIEIAAEDEDILLMWTAVGGKRYVLQTSTGYSGGFSNDFVDLNPAIVATGTGDTEVSVLHLGAATNAPTRFYRVRLLPSP
jgi:hypothetical protein